MIVYVLSIPAVETYCINEHCVLFAAGLQMSFVYKCKDQYMTRELFFIMGKGYKWISWCKQWGWKYTLEGQKRKSQAFVFIVFSDVRPHCSSKKKECDSISLPWTSQGCIHISGHPVILRCAHRGDNSHGLPLSGFSFIYKCCAEN